MIKARFKIQLSDKKILPPRYPSATARPALGYRPLSKVQEIAVPNIEDLFSSDIELHLEDEVPARELNRFAACILKCHAMMQKSNSTAETLAKLLCDARCELSTLTRLKTEYEDTKSEKAKHIILTKKLIKATEPILNYSLVPEKEKTSLLETVALAVEKMTQLKIRQTNLAARIKFIKKETPRHIFQLGKKMKSSEQLCFEICQLTETALSDHA